MVSQTVIHTTQKLAAGDMSWLTKLDKAYNEVLSALAGTSDRVKLIQILSKQGKAAKLVAPIAEGAYEALLANKTLRSRLILRGLDALDIHGWYTPSQFFTDAEANFLHDLDLIDYGEYHGQLQTLNRNNNPFAMALIMESQRIKALRKEQVAEPWA